MSTSRLTPGSTAADVWITRGGITQIEGVPNVMCSSSRQSALFGGHGQARMWVLGAATHQGARLEVFVRVGGEFGGVGGTGLGRKDVTHEGGRRPNLAKRPSCGGASRL